MQGSAIRHWMCRKERSAAAPNAELASGTEWSARGCRSVLNVKPVDEEDANAYDLSESFDYSQTPTPRLKLQPESIPESSLNLPPAPEEDT
jgi:hypothetical protein